MKVEFYQDDWGKIWLFNVYDIWVRTELAEGNTFKNVINEPANGVHPVLHSVDKFENVNSLPVSPPTIRVIKEHPRHTFGKI